MYTNSTTVLNQLLYLLPEERFQTFVGQHEADRYVKTFSCFNQLTTLLFAQATEKDSLRDISTSLRSLDSMWQEVGLKSVARSTIAYANEHRPWQIYQSLFYALLEQCQILVPGQQTFSFRNDLQILDATTIDLCLNLFPWAKFRTRKGAIKIHTRLNQRTQIPDIICITDGKTHEVTIAKDMDFTAFAKGTIFVIDRGYYDLGLLQKIKDAGHHFVIRLKSNAQIVRLGQHRNATGEGVLKDECIAFMLSAAQYKDNLRLVTFYDEEHDVTYEFLTDEFRLSALNIAAIYKKRWDIEIFFKWIKQNLKIKTFFGTSKNAVLTQIWIAMIYFLLLKWLKHQLNFRGSLTDLTRMIATVILHRVQFVELASLRPNTLNRLRIRAGPQPSLF
ncbi:MAG: IS4 family transposase [Patescibacteria group bacterium]